MKTKIKETIYYYQDKSGLSVLKITRIDYSDGTKEFPNSFLHKDTWKNINNNIPVMPYRFKEWSQKKGPIFLVEGEKCADALLNLGLLCTTTPRGANGWKEYFASLFKDRLVIILPDNDEPGRSYAQRAKNDICKVAKLVRIIELPGLPIKGDIVNWLEQGHNAKDLLKIVENTDTLPLSYINPIDQTPNLTSFDNNQKYDPFITLEKILNSMPHKLFMDDSKVNYICLTNEKMRPIFPIRSEGFGSFLTRSYFKETKKGISENAIEQLKNLLNAKCTTEASIEDVFVRMGKSIENYYLDLVNDSGLVIKINSNSWEITNQANINFLRPGGILPLPIPVQNGDIYEIKKFLNIDEENLILVFAFIIKALIFETGACPILIITGEQGSAKSTATKIVKTLIDPSKMSLGVIPKDDRELVLTAKNSLILAYDNLSNIRPEMADSLCRVSTGFNFCSRKLYSDCELVMHSIKRTVIINGITELSNRADLIDRAITLHFKAIPNEKRMSEKEIWEIFEKVHPQILGAILDLCVSTLEILPSIKVTTLPRMADFAKVGIAIERILGLESGHFMKVYQKNMHEQNEILIEGDIVTQALIKFLTPLQNWSGTMTDLYLALTNADDSLKELKRSAINWPTGPRNLGDRLARSSQLLKTFGVTIKKDRQANRRKISLSISSLSSSSSFPLEFK